MDQTTLDAYVRSTLQLQDYVLDEEQVQRVIAQFACIEEISRPMRDLDLLHWLDPAAVFRP